MAKQKIEPTERFWGIPQFPTKVKNDFMGLCKMTGKDYKKSLANLIRGWVRDTLRDKKGN